MCHGANQGSETDTPKVNMEWLIQENEDGVVLRQWRSCYQTDDKCHKHPDE